MVADEFKKTLRLLSLLLVTTIFNSTAPAQRTNVSPQQISEALSLKIQTKDKRHLNKFIDKFAERIREQNWENVYEMLSPNLIDNRTKDEFVEDMKRDSSNPNLDRKVIGFIPTSYFVLNEDKYREKVHVTGCLKVSIKNSIHQYWGTIDIERFGSDKWLFNSFFYVNPNSSSNGPKMCNEFNGKKRI